MPEYIVDCEHVPYGDGLTLVLPISINGHVHEPITRCRDCEYGRAVEDIGCIAFQHSDERLQPKDPDGFCKWAIPRSDDGNRT